MGFGASAALWIGGILTRTKGPVIWAFAHRDLFAPGLAGVGVDPDPVIHVEAGDGAASRPGRLRRRGFRGHDGGWSCFGAEAASREPSSSARATFDAVLAW